MVASQHLRLVRPDEDVSRVTSLPRRKPLGDILRDNGALSPGDHIKALALQRRQEARLGDILLAHGMVTEDQLMAGLARQWSTRIVDPVADHPDHRLIDRLGADQCLRKGLLPWRHLGGATVIVTAWPEDFARHRDRLTALYGPVVMAIAPERKIHSALLAARKRQLRSRAESSVADQDSCRGWRSDRLAAAGTLLAVVAAALLAFAPLALFWLLSVAAILTLLSNTVLKASAIWARLPSLREEMRPVDPLKKQPVPPAVLPIVSIMVPMFKEPDIAPRLVARLSRLNYPRELLDVLLVIEECDEETRIALEGAELPRWMRIISVPDGPVKTKPRAMNFALDFCRGSIIGVYDAEDAPEADQLHKVVRRFHEKPEVACLQGVLDFYNARTNWLSRCFTVEYGAWFRVILPGLQRLGLPVPLGGTTFFIRREPLEALGRWDAHNVTEDCDLGVRLARHGFKTELVATVTQEEANCRPIPWVKQRSRWIKGYAITWAVAMRDPGGLRRRVGTLPFIGMQMMFIGNLSQPLLAPILWTFWLLALGMGHPFAGLGMPVIVALVALFLLAELVNIIAGCLATATPKRRWLMIWVPTLHFYYPLAALAAYKAFYELAVKPFYWDKTTHGLFDTGADLEEAEPA